MSDNSNGNDSDYRPIDCGVYSGYELAIMHREWLQLSWHDADGLDHLERLQPYDLRTADGAEYLLARNHLQVEHRIRLDLIIHAEPHHEAPHE